MHKPRRFDLYPDDFLAGIAGQLMPDEAGMYLVVLLLIYSRGGETDDDPKAIARLFKIAYANKVKRLLDRLVSIGKLSRIDGKLTQDRARIESKSAQNRVNLAVIHGKLGGRPSNKSTTYDNQLVLSSEKLPSPSPSPSPSKKESKSENGASAPPDGLKAQLFGACLNYLGSMNGGDGNKYRSLIGKWIKDHGAETTLNAFLECQKSYRADPVSYITKILKPSGRRNLPI
jgi:hypothetical protein